MRTFLLPLFNTPPVATPPATGTPEGGAGGGGASPPIAVPRAPAPPPAPGKVTPKVEETPKVETPPKVEKPPEKPPAKPPAKEAHEAFLTAEFDPEDPLWKGGHTGLPTFEQILEVTSEPGRKFLANVRADYTRKTTELAREREAMRTQLATESASIAAERERLANLATPEFKQHLETLKAAAKGADPFTAEGQEALAEAKAVALYEKMIAPIQEQVASEARKAHFRSYIAANPDFEQPETRKGVMAILQAKPHLELEEAHDLWRGSRAREEATRLRTLQSGSDAERTKTLRQTGAGGLANTETEEVPTFKNATQALAYHQARGMK